MRVNEALRPRDAAAEGIHAAVVDMFTIKPIDVECIVSFAEKTGAVVTAENESILGGLGSAVAEVLVEHRPVPMERVGVEDRFGEVGDQEWLKEHFKLTAPFICGKARRVLSRKG
jgi:transketolase